MLVHQAYYTALGKFCHFIRISRITNGILALLIEEGKIHMRAAATFVGEGFWQAREHDAMLQSFALSASAILK